MNYSKAISYLNSAYGCSIAKHISNIGNIDCSMGFKNAGSTGEKKAADFIEKEMRNIGLQEVGSFTFNVDSWEYTECKLSYTNSFEDLTIVNLSAFAGSCGVEKKVVQADVIDAAYGTLNDCEKVNVDGKIAFVRVNTDLDYWLGEPTYQLELKKAVAVIVMLEGYELGNCCDALNSGDAISRCEIPILNISKQDGKALIKAMDSGTIAATLNVDIHLSKGTSQNIIGKVSGENDDEWILIGAHYDSFFKAYMDNAFGVGVIFNIARAIVNSGSKPKHTIVFIAHGAEEFGVKCSHYDWCIGSWQQISKITPEWSEKIKLFLNVDAVNKDSQELLIQASPQLRIFIEECMLEIKQIIDNYWGKGYSIGDINGPFSDDYCYYMAGIPVAIIGRGPSEWRKKYYHTNYDTADELNEKLMEHICLVYSMLTCEFDDRGAAELDMRLEIEAFERSIDRDLFEKEEIPIEHLIKELIELKNRIEENMEINAFPVEQGRSKSFLCKSLIPEIRALDFDDNAIFRLEETQKNLRVLNTILEKLIFRDMVGAKETAISLSGYSIIRDFEAKVYEFWCITALDSKKYSLQWGEKAIQLPLDLRGLYKAMSIESFEKSIKEASRLKEDEKEKAKKNIGHIIKKVQYLNSFTYQKIKP
jgi:N-acetylated-alpha-linked acidic dipeptidase